MLLQNHQAGVKDSRGARGSSGVMSPNPQRSIGSPARTRAGSSNLASVQTAPSSSTLQRQSSSTGLYRQPSSAALQKQLSSSLVALLRQGSGNSPALQRGTGTSPALQRGTSPALQRRSGERGTSPALQRPATSSSALQRPGTASSPSSAAQRQGSSAGLDRLLSQGGLAALLRQASSNSPIRHRPENPVAVQQQRQSHSPAVQRPEVSMQRQEANKGKAPMRASSPNLQRAGSSRTGSAARAVRGSSPVQRQQGGLAAPVVAADFARRGSSGVLTNAPSGELVSRNERVRSPFSMSLVIVYR